MVEEDRYAGVGRKNSAMEERESAYGLISSLIAGTAAMRAKRSKYLPQFPAESMAKYEARLESTFLHGMFEDTVDKLASRPYSRPVTILGEDAVPEFVREIEEDADLTGRPLSDFMHDDFKSCASYGISVILVDLPILRGDETMGEIRTRGIRPYLVHVPATRILGWKSERRGNGKREMTQFRYAETVEVDDGSFGSKSVEQVRVYDAPGVSADGEPIPGSWQIFRRGSDGRWATWALGSFSVGRIPAVVWYTERSGFMLADPPLEGLAWKNLEHWQSSSDQRNVLHFSRTGTMYATGLEDDEYDAFDQEVAVGINQVLRSKNAEARFGIVEHTGKAVESGETDLKRIEDQCEMLGLQPMVEQARDTTATATRMRSGEKLTRLQSWIIRQEKAYAEVLRIAAEMMGESIPDGVAVDVFSDFAAVGSTDDFEFLDKARARGDISNETYLVEAKRRGIVSDTLDVEAEVERATEEASKRMAAFTDATGGGGISGDSGEES